MREHSSNQQTDIDTLLRALALNWAILGTDARLKPARVLPVAEEFLQGLLDSALAETHARVAEKHSGPFLDQLITLIRNHTETRLATITAQ